MRRKPRCCQSYAFFKFSGSYFLFPVMLVRTPPVRRKGKIIHSIFMSCSKGWGMITVLLQPMGSHATTIKGFFMEYAQYFLR